ncbi:hypothetical protein D3C76_803370 [compost metagenome]
MTDEDGMYKVAPKNKAMYISQIEVSKDKLANWTIRSCLLIASSCSKKVLRLPSPWCSTMTPFGFPVVPDV